MTKDKVAAIIPAAGLSARFGEADKVFAPLAEKPVLAHVIDVFQECQPVDRIIIVVNIRSLERCRQLVVTAGWSKVTEICSGGERRQDSVLVALMCLQSCDWVIIHDGARPLLTVDLITEGLVVAAETGAAVAAVPARDTIKIAQSDRLIKQTPPRQNLWIAQTPQIFRFDLIMEAYRHLKNEVTDDASLVEQLGYQAKLYPGAYDNIKITTPEDLVVAEALLRERAS